MYEELVETLRETADKRMHEAADAIEELVKLTDAQLGIIKQYQAYLTKQRWIPVTERLPEEWKKVLTFQTTSEDEVIIQTCVYIGIPGKWRQAWNHEFLDLPVTHWMPLPMPPKEE